MVLGAADGTTGIITRWGREGDDMKLKYSINPVVEEIDHKYVRFWELFRIYSVLVGGYICLPVGFCCDRESTPAIRGTSIRGGYGHDLLCRKDAADFIVLDEGREMPVMTKKFAADVYLEIMKRRYGLLNDAEWEQAKTKRRKARLLLTKWNRWNRRYVKHWAVRLAWGYFCKHRVMSTYFDITGRSE